MRIGSLQVFQLGLGEALDQATLHKETYDPDRQVTISYNHLDLPTRIIRNHDYIDMVYDAAGNLLQRKRYTNYYHLLETRDYINGTEYVNGNFESAYHAEGRVHKVGSTYRNEYHLKDHLGNVRLVYADLNNDGLVQTPSEIIKEIQYYPFGMVMDGPWIGSGVESTPYQYNGIELVEDMELDLNMAFFRTLDPSTGRWWQVDPKGEAMKSATPYGAMNGNPFTYSDPKGDIALQFLGGVIRGLVNGDPPLREGVRNVGRMFEIGAGLFATDNSLSTGDQAWQLLSRFTWEAMQTLVGQVVAQTSNTVGLVENVETFRGVTVVASDAADGAYTLGHVITGEAGMRGDFRDHLFVHEYGHYLQSKRLGPLYLSFVAWPSVTDLTVETVFGNAFGDHDFRWYETQASALAANYFDREFGSGQPGYTFRDPNFFDRQSFVNRGGSPYRNPRNLNFNFGANPVNSRFHWTDIFYSLKYNAGLGLLGFL